MPAGRKLSWIFECHTDMPSDGAKISRRMMFPLFGSVSSVARPCNQPPNEQGLTEKRKSKAGATG